MRSSGDHSGWMLGCTVVRVGCEGGVKLIRPCWSECFIGLNSEPGADVCRSSGEIMWSMKTGKDAKFWAERFDFSVFSSFFHACSRRSLTFVLPPPLIMLFLSLSHPLTLLFPHFLTHPPLCPPPLSPRHPRSHFLQLHPLRSLIHSFLFPPVSPYHPHPPTHPLLSLSLSLSNGRCVIGVGWWWWGCKGGCTDM